VKILGYLILEGCAALSVLGTNVRNGKHGLESSPTKQLALFVWTKGKILQVDDT
jgi:hypothetical protein